jgi:hypothetical protein
VIGAQLFLCDAAVCFGNRRLQYGVHSGFREAMKKEHKICYLYDKNLNQHLWPNLLNIFELK